MEWEDQDTQAPEEAPKKRRQPKDPEIEALRTVIEVLSPLESDAQQRIVAWASARFASPSVSAAIVSG